MPGTRSFREALQLTDQEVAVFGWMEFSSKSARDKAHKEVAQDERMKELIAPLFMEKPPIFEPKRMLYGGFVDLVRSDKK